MSTSVPLSKEKSEPEAVGILSAADALNLLISLPSGVAGKLGVQGADATDLHPDGRGTVRVAGVELEVGGAGCLHVCPVVQVRPNHEANLSISIGLAGRCLSGCQCCFDQLATLLKEETLRTIKVAQSKPLNVCGAGLIELKSGAVGCGQSRSGHEVRCFDSYRIQQNDPRSTATRPVR